MRAKMTNINRYLTLTIHQRIDVDSTNYFLGFEESWMKKRKRTFARSLVVETKRPRL